MNRKKFFALKYSAEMGNKMKKSIRQIISCVLVFSLAFSLTACGRGKDSGRLQENTAIDVHVFIAASLNNAMEEIKEIYKEKNPNVEIIYHADSSGTLKTQIEEGGECDIFFSAAAKQMDELEEEDYLLAGTRRDLLENKVVLIKPKGRKTKVTGFETITEASNLALAGEDVPVGAYAREIFENLGIREQVMDMDINEGINVTAVLAAVGEGSNEIGIVYETDAKSMPESVEIISKAPEGILKTPVHYPAAMVKNPSAKEGQTEAARDFLSFLFTEQALAIFETYGFSKA